MLTIDEYIAKMKRSDKLDEFDYTKQSENMGAVMKYVMSYFNEYLTMETCDAETIKLKHATDKLEEEIEKRYPKSKDFILNFYLQYKIRIHKEIDKWLEDLPYFPFFYSEHDFSSAAKNFSISYKIKGANMEEYESNITTLIAEIKQYNTECLSPSEMIHLDNNIVKWVKETYRQYGVNLFSFAYNLADTYHDRYVKYERERYGERLYYVNNYNYRYNNNPFDIDRIYGDNKHRPFLENKRGELEMMVMHEWLFTMVYDDDYWPEYVNLCVSRGRVNIVGNVNALLPVSSSGLNYPEDASCLTEHIITTDGVLKKKPEKPYILRVEVSQTYAGVWQNSEEMTSLTNALNASFKEFGVPKVLELTAPVKTASFDEEIFILCCSILEKKMKKNTQMKVAIVNGLENKMLKQKPKPISYLNTIEDLIKLKVQLRERKIPLRFSIDFPALLGSKRSSSYSQSEVFGALTEIKNSIVCLNITNFKTQESYGPRYKQISKELDAYYLHKFKHPTYDDFYTMLSAAFNDNQKRYLIPKGMANDAELEELVDNLLRSGFAFCDGGGQHE